MISNSVWPDSALLQQSQCCLLWCKKFGVACSYSLVSWVVVSVLVRLVLSNCSSAVIMCNSSRAEPSLLVALHRCYMPQHGIRAVPCMASAASFCPFAGLLSASLLMATALSAALSKAACLTHGRWQTHSTVDVADRNSCQMLRVN